MNGQSVCADPAEPARFKEVCGYGVMTGIHAEDRLVVDGPLAPGGLISHGMCDECRAAMRTPRVAS